MLRSFTMCMRHRSTIVTSAALATMVETAAVMLVQCRKKKLPHAADAFLLPLPNGSTSRKPAPIRSYVLRKTVASRLLLPLRDLQHSGVPESCPPAKVAQFTAGLRTPPDGRLQPVT